MPSEKSAATQYAPDLAYSTVDTAVPAARSRMRSFGVASSTRRVSQRQRRSKPKVMTEFVRS
jgi:hypothetical protein